MKLTFLEPDLFATGELIYMENYKPYEELVTTGYIRINTVDITNVNWHEHFNAILNIFKDGIETEKVHNMIIEVIFADGLNAQLYIFDYFFNLIMWNCIIQSGQKIYAKHIFFPDNITQDDIKSYIDSLFIDENRTKLLLGTKTPDESGIVMNNLIDYSLYYFSPVDLFSLYLADTINLEDNIILEKLYPRTREIFHASLANVSLESNKDEGLKLTNELIGYIKDSNHCLSDSFRSKTGVKPKQYKEVMVNIGSKPDGGGGVFPTPIDTNFINGGVNNLTYNYIESSGGRTAQILSKCNVGKSGHFARLLSLNNRDTWLHPDPEFSCNTKTLQKIFLKNKKFLEQFENRYYRLVPNGVEKVLTLKDTHLIGQTVYFRSPMTCESAVRGHGICYRCYGNLAYTNSNISIGQFASANLSSELTQRLLSAKHLLESAVRKLRWNKEFYSIFEVEFNIIKLIDNVDFKGYKLVINPDDIIAESEEDEYEYNEYINSFEIHTSFGKVITIQTEDADSLYISNDLNDMIRLKGSAVSGMIELPMDQLLDCGLFLIYMTNNELSKSLEMIKSIVNKDSITSKYDRDGILQAFNEAVLDGGLHTTSVHLEVILSNQIRAVDDILLKPDWSNINEDCSVLTLNKALTDNPSVTTSLSYQKLSKAMYNPLTYKKNKASFLDLLFMKQPQQFMSNPSLIPYEYMPEDTSKPNNVIKRIY